ncbi:MAG: radical SAM family heme chaperone HemW [Eubacterium sp.]
MQKSNMTAGLYIHIPFCKSKCPYCDFYSVKYQPDVATHYVDRLISTMDDYHGTFDTIYFGGGTPSILPAGELGRIIEAAKNHFVISDDCEITVECNPSKDMAQDFVLYRHYGVNRISIGMQSAVDKERFALGRAAGRYKVQKTIADARNAGINNISLDIMLGTPKQSLESLDETLSFVDSMAVQHISAYMLKIEEGTRFYKMRDNLPLPCEDDLSAMYLKVVDSLNKMGLHQYEISNFALPGYESRHNKKYWQLAPYLGLGKSAHSYWNGRRFYYDQEFNLVNDGVGGSDEERIMLGLRLTEGVDKSLLNRDVTPYIDMGLMTYRGDRVALTPQGMLVSNTIISQLMAL